MKHARSLPPRRRRSLRMATLLGLVAAGWGCQQPAPYFTFGSGAPGCTPVVPAAPAHSGVGVGEPTTEVIGSGTPVAVPSRTTNVVGSPTPTRVVVSEPEGRPRSSWRPRSDVETSIATSVEGGTRVSADPTAVR